MDQAIGAVEGLARAAITEAARISEVRKKYGNWQKEMTDWKYKPTKTCYITKNDIINAAPQFNPAAIPEGTTCWGKLLAQFGITPDITPLSECNIAIDGLPAVRCDIAALTWIVYSSEGCTKWTSSDGADLALSGEGVEVLLHDKGNISGGLRTLGHITVGSNWKPVPWSQIDIPDVRSYIQLIHWVEALDVSNNLEPLKALFNHASKVLQEGWAPNKLLAWDTSVSAVYQRCTGIVDTLALAGDANDREKALCDLVKEAGILDLDPLRTKMESIQSWEVTQRNFRRGVHEVLRDAAPDVTVRDKATSALQCLIVVMLSFDPVPSTWAGQRACAVA